MKNSIRKNLLEAGISAGEIAKLINARVSGDSSTLIHSLSALNEPVKDCLTFAKTLNQKELSLKLSQGLIAAIILPKEIDTADKVTQLIVEDPLQAIALLAKKFLGIENPPPGISKFADIHPEATIGKDVHIGAFCSVGAGVKIGDSAVLYPQVVVYQGAVIGDNSIIHSGAVIRENCRVGSFCVVQNGAVIGADGFGYFLNQKKKLQAVPQVGNVVLENEVEVGANSCIDRGTLGSTHISNMTKVDNLVQIGHNTKIGAASIICGNVGIAGSTEIGAGVTLGGGVGVADHVKIASGVRVGGNSGVTGHLTEKADYLGFPAIKAGDWKRQAKSIEKLPEFMRKVKKIVNLKEHE